MARKQIGIELLRRALCVAFVMVISLACFAQFEGGRGTEGDPYQIRTAEHLNNVREFLGDEHRETYFVLIADIDLDVEPFNEGEGWEPIGSDEHGHFCGNFDGGRYKISNLMINGEREHLAFFGTVRGAKISNVGLKNVNITGGHYVAGLVARVFGEGETHIQRCYVTGTVSGMNFVGGLIGVTHDGDPTIEDCYSVATINFMEERAGGLIAEVESGRIFNCYSIGTLVSEREPHEGMGAVIGMTHGGEIRNIRFSPDLCGVEWAVGNMPDEFRGNTPQELMVRDTYEEFNFDEIWHIRDNGSFPYFQWQGEEPEDHNLPPLYPPSELRATADDRLVDLRWSAPPDEVDQPDGYNVYRDDRLINDEPVRETQYRDGNLTNFTRYSYKVTAVYGEMESLPGNTVAAVPYRFGGGDGTQNNPYHIATAAELNGIRFFNFHFIQTNNISLGVAPWNEGEGWVPIGDNANHFQGSFDGNNYYITGLTINRPAGIYQALFGSIENSVIQRVGLRDVDVVGMNMVAGLVGSVRTSTIHSSYVTGSVEARGAVAYTAGLVGFLSTAGCFVYDCYSTADVTAISTLATQYIGGVVSYLYRGDVRRCYSTGTVTPGVPSQNAGAVIGRVDPANTTYAHLYWNSDTSGLERGVGNLDTVPGTNTTDFLRRETFVGFDFDRAWFIAQGASYPYLQWEGEEPGNHNRPPLLPPQNLTARGGNGVVNLTWFAPPDIIGRPLGYNVYRDGERINVGLVDVTQYQDTDLANWIHYTYYVTAVYQAGESMPGTSARALTIAFAGGAGTPQNPYLVETEAQLNGVRLLLGSHFRQIDDIVIAAETWRPIGDFANNNLENTFRGTYDGGGFTVSGISMMGGNYLGFFGFLTGGATVKNVKLENVNIRNAGLYSGALASNVSNSSVINCSATGSLTAEHMAGGLIGFLSGGLLADSWSGIEFTTTRGAGGGLVGVIGQNGTVSGCFSRGSTISEGTTSDIGGLIGWVNSGLVTNSYTRSRVTTPVNNTNVGGLIGRNQGTVTNCYAIGRIVGGENAVGGLIGNNTGNVSNSYWDSELTERETSAGGTRKLTRNMVYPYDGETYLNWNFETIWMDDPHSLYNGGYPTLRHQVEGPVFLDTPQPAIINRTVAGVERVYITWEAVEGANSYKIYASNNPYGQDWGQPIAVVAGTEYTEPINRVFRYYYVVASVVPAP